MMHRIEPGQRLGGYLIEHEIGRGAFGVVYRARQIQRAERPVAIKVPARAGALAELLHAARLLGRLSHPGIVRMLEILPTACPPLLVMELCEGPTLRQRIQAGPLDVGEMGRIMLALLDALGAAHAAGVVHRDLKPSNVVLTAGGPRLLDLGLGCLVGALEHSMVSTGIAGTAAYMAPEQRAGMAVDGRADLYSLGVMLFESLTGRLPGLHEPLVPGGRTEPARAAALDRLYRELTGRVGDRPACAEEARARLLGILAPHQARTRRPAAASSVPLAAELGQAIRQIRDQKRVSAGEEIE